MYLVTEKGRKVEVPPQWESIFIPVLKGRGLLEVDNIKELNEHLKEETLVVERRVGGLGDIITILPGVEEKLKYIKDITLVMPSQYSWMFRHLNITYIDYYIFALHYLENRKKFKYYIDLYCPGVKHEIASLYKPYRNRIENFADKLGVKAFKPIIRPNLDLCDDRFTTNDKKVGIVLKSALPIKDYPLDRLSNICIELKKKGYRPITIDGTKTINNIEYIVGVSQEKLAACISQLDLIITPDTGVLHLAAALDIPAIGLFGATDGRLTCKYYTKTKVLQKLDGHGRCYRPCYYNISHNNFYCGRKIGACMLEITEEEILNAVDAECA